MIRSAERSAASTAPRSIIEALGSTGVIDVVEGHLGDDIRSLGAPGDAIVFDEMNLHRTGFGPHLAPHRFAPECWFFAPTDHPLDQVLLAV